MRLTSDKIRFKISKKGFTKMNFNRPYPKLGESIREPFLFDLTLNILKGRLICFHIPINKFIICMHTIPMTLKGRNRIFDRRSPHDLFTKQKNIYF